ncbi:MAG TPA: replication-associated recombination protein A [Terracidiphilus sp.]|nr:replication-associated recombination protein A [Terracidiphilus sp.]
MPLNPVQPSASLFAEPEALKPLAERMRPRNLDEIVGQRRLVAPDRALRRALEAGRLHSMVLWGPPGCGKTTLALLVAQYADADFKAISAVLSGLPEVRKALAEAEANFAQGRRTVLFVDEVHRFNKAQQDAFLPYVERGTIRLIGATTENPSFEIISALLSRCRVYVLEPLTDEQIAALLRKALEDKERGLGKLELTADDDALELIASYSSGDCRSAYNTLEVAAQLAQEKTQTGAKHIDRALAGVAVQQRVLMYDKSGEEHYNLISALHKSVRNSDPDAALYWLARMFAAGEDPLYLARRVVRMAVEDIGLAAPEALNLCLSAKETIDFLGSPEGDLALAEAVVYLCLAPKSNSVYTAYGAVQAEVEHTRQEPVPLRLRNAPTRLMKELDYGKGYRYAHDEEGRVADMDCLPDSLKGRSYYKPTQEGREKLLAQRMEEIQRIRAGKREGN